MGLGEGERERMLIVGRREGRLYSGIVYISEWKGAVVMLGL